MQNPFHVLLLFLLMMPLYGAKAAGYEEALSHYQAGDYAKAYCIWNQLAEQGHVVAQYSLGWMYANGEGLAVNTSEGVKWWRKSAKLGHPDAHFALGLAYTTGEGVKKNPLESIRWHLEASQLGHEDSQAILYDLVIENFNTLAPQQQHLLQQAWRMLGASNTLRVKFANVRRGPGTKNKVISMLRKGNEFFEFRRRNKWIQVGIPGKTVVGWVHQSLTQ